MPPLVSSPGLIRSILYNTRTYKRQLIVYNRLKNKNTKQKLDLVHSLLDVALLGLAVEALAPELVLEGVLAAAVEDVQAEGRGAEDEKQRVRNADVALGDEHVPDPLTLLSLIGLMLTQAPSNYSIHFFIFSKTLLCE